MIIKIVNFAFNPNPVTVNAGQTVTWEWQADDHSTTSDDGIWDSGVRSRPFSFSHKFTEADAGKTFRYFCSEHGNRGGVGMSGSIMVMSGSVMVM